MITITLPWWALLAFTVLLIILGYVDVQRAKMYKELMEEISEMYDNVRMGRK